MKKALSILLILACVLTLFCSCDKEKVDERLKKCETRLSDFEKQVLNMYRGMTHTRCDDTQTVFYFSSEDFPGLQKERYGFRASAGHMLEGYIYQYENPIVLL